MGTSTTAQQAIPADQMNSAWSPAPAPTPSAPAAQPAPASAAQPTTVGPPQFQGAAGPTPMSPGSPVANTQPSQAPIAVKPPIDPRPYALLAEQSPKYRQIIDQAADETGVSPERLAWHWWRESGFKPTVPDGKAGENGPMQIMPETAQRFNARGLLDPHNLSDSLVLAGRYIHYLDGRYGKDSPSSVGAYQGGEGSIDDIAAHPDTAAQRHPNTMAYVKAAFAGSGVDGKNFVGASSMTPNGIVDAASQGGPDGFLRYISQSAPRGMPMGDAMRQAEATLVGWAAARGDYAGMQHARDYMLQLSHAGSNQNLMGAYQAIQSGDGVSASQYLARAHAFFPDGTIGRFGVDKSGAVWGERFDESDPSRRVGGPFQVTPQGIETLLNQTTDPGKYLQTVQEQQKNAAYTRHLDTMGQYYTDLIHSREEIAAQHDTTSLARARIGADSRVTSAEIRAGRQGQGPANQLARDADKEASNLYGDLGPYADVPVQQRGVMGEVYSDVRMQGVSPPQSRAVVEGLANGTLRAVKGEDGSYGVVSGNSQQPIAYLSPGLGDRLFGAAMPAQQPGAGPVPGAQTNQPGRSPIGAAASTPYARGAGVSNNLTGTVMPQAPQPPAQAVPTDQSSALPPGQ